MKRTSSMVSDNVSIDRSMESSIDEINKLLEISPSIVSVADNMQAVLSLSTNLPNIEIKLAGIEDNATRDQTDLEIKTGYENNINTNVYTDIDLTKVSNISVTQPVDLDALNNANTDLSYLPSILNGTIVNSDGTNAVIELAVSNGNAGLLSGLDKAKIIAAENILSNIAVTQSVDLDTMEADISLNSLKISNVGTDLSYAASATEGVIESSDGTDATISLAIAGGDAGLSSGSDKAKLDGIEASSNNYVHPSTDGNIHIPANGTTNDGKVLTASAVAGVYTWEISSVGFSDPMTTQGDMVFRNSSNSTARLPAGINGQVLTSDGTNLSWQTSSTGVTDHLLLSNIGTNNHGQIDTHIADTSTHYSQSSISITESQISDLGAYISTETSHADVLVDSDFGSAGLMKTDGAGVYSVDSGAYSLTTHNHDLVYEPIDATIVKDADIGVTVEAFNSDIVKAPSGVLPILDGSNLTNVASGGGVTSHLLLTNIGTNTHAQIDTHIADNSTHYPQSSISITQNQISDLGPYISDDDFTANGLMRRDGAGNYSVDALTYSESSHNHTGVYEPVDSDIVRAPLDVLPALDGSNLTNISSSISGDTLAHSFLQNESVAINLSAPVTTAIVSVTKEIPQTGISTNAWDVLADGSNYETEDSSPDTSLIVTNSKAWDIDFLNYFGKTLNVSAQDTSPDEIVFKPDGTKMFMIGSSSDSIHEYDLSTAWEINTGVYSNKSFSFSSQDSSPRNVVFKPDGTKVFMLGSGSDSIHEYTLSTPWDIDTLVYTNKSFQVTAQDTTASNLTANADGTKMYMIGFATNSIYEYALSTAWDIDTLSYSNKSFDLSSETTSSAGGSFKYDGKTLYTIGFATDSIYEYTLSTAWDIDTLVFTGKSFQVNTQEGTPRGLTIKQNGTSFYIVGSATDSAYQYDIKAETRMKLESGNFQASDISKVIKSGSGEGILIDITGRIEIISNFDDTKFIDSNLWKMEAIDFDTSGAKLSSFSGNIPGGGTGALSSLGNSTKIQEFDNGDIALFSKTGTTGQTPITIRIIKRDGSIVLNSANVVVGLKEYKTYRFGSNNIMFYNSTTFNIINSLGVVSTANTIVNNYSTHFGVSGGALPNDNVWTAGYNGAANALVIHEYQDNGISTPTITQLTGVLVHNDVQRLPNGNFMVFHAASPNRYMTILDPAGNIVLASTILNLGANANAHATISGVFENGNVILVYVYDSGTAVLRYVIYDKDGNEVQAPSIVAPLHVDKYKCELMADGRIAVYYKVSAVKIAVSYITSDGNSVIEETVSTDNVPSNQLHDAFKHSDGSLIFTFLNKYQIFDYANNYVLNQHTPLITNQAGQIDSTYFTDIISTTTEEEANGQEINYAFSIDDKSTWIVLKTIDGQRSIARDNGGTWEYNSNVTYSATTWTPATMNNQFQALSEAMSITSNKMSITQLESVQDNEFFTLTNTIDSAIVLFTNDGIVTPTVKDIIINYDANILNKGAVNGVDYEYDQPTTTQVRIKSLAKNNLKIRVL